MTKTEIEIIANIKIRRGFDKLLDKALLFFNLNNKNIDQQSAYDVIKFINRSNSKLCEAYWVLRTNKSKAEYDIEMKQFIEEFIELPYKKSSRRAVSKKFTTENASRGYSGWAEINGNRYYCRSQQEFIWLSYLNIIYSSLEYKILTEEKIYYYDGMSYKPDVFLYKNDELIKLFEIKDCINNISDKCRIFANYFESINIFLEFLVNGKSLLSDFPQIRENLKIWKNNQANIKNDMSGKNNPRYGAIVSDVTRKKIGDKSRERCKDVNYRKKLSDANKKAMTPERRKQMSESKLAISKRNRELSLITDPFISRKCKICENDFDCRQSSEKMTCSRPTCAYKYNVQIGKTQKISHTAEEYKLRFMKALLNQLSKINFSECTTFSDMVDVITRGKKSGDIRKNFGISADGLMQYFGTFEKLNKELNK